MGDVNPRTAAKAIASVAATIRKTHPKEAKVLDVAARYVASLGPSTAKKPTRTRRRTPAELGFRPGEMSAVPGQQPVTEGAVASVRYVDQTTRAELHELATMLELLAERADTADDYRDLKSALTIAGDVGESLRQTITPRPVVEASRSAIFDEEEVPGHGRLVRIVEQTV